jgi:hypothetical protein
VESNWVHSQHCGHQWPIVPALGEYDDGEIGGMIGRGNWSTWRNPAPVPLCPPQTPHATWTWTRATVVGSQCLTAWATAQPKPLRLLNYALCHEELWGSGGINLPFLTLALHGGECSASCTGCFNLRERVPGTHWVGCRACLDAREKRKISSPCWELNPGHSACTLSLYTY